LERNDRTQLERRVHGFLIQAVGVKFAPCWTTTEVVGSPNVTEIELNHVLINEWPNVMKWLKNFDLLRSAGMERLILRV
jgi:hypothetical protein